MNDLEKILKFDDALPYLFVGSGFSRRYLDTPDWIGLLSHFCQMIYPDDEFAFKSIQERAKQQVKAAENKSLQSTNDINCAIADILENEFNMFWYKSPLFAESREKNKTIVSPEVTPFKIELANYFNDMLNKELLLPSELEKLELITSNSIAGVITTNYDCLIEKYFNFTKYTSQEELLFSTTQEFCEIYKIHGCATNPGSIIINSDDYLKVAEKRKYLAAKLLTIFVEHPIIFIGYSLNDEDITTILSDIVDCLNDEQLEILRSRLIFIDRLKNPSVPDYEVEKVSIIINSKSLPMTKISLRDYGLLYEVLSQNKSKYPVKILRALKQNIYDLVASNDPTDKLRIMLPLEQIDSFKDVEYVIGVGAAKIAELGYKGFPAEDIYRDIIYDDRQFNADFIIEQTLPEHLSRTGGSMPMYKYLLQYTKPTLPDKYAHYLRKQPNIECLFNTSLRNGRSTQPGSSVAEIWHRYEFPKSKYYISRLPISNIDKQELREYIISILEANPNIICSGPGYIHSSDIRRLIKIYDWLMYHDDFIKKQASIQSVPQTE